MNKPISTFETPEEAIAYFDKMKEKLQRNREDMRMELDLDFERSMRELREARQAVLAAWPDYVDEND